MQSHSGQYKSGSQKSMDASGVYSGRFSRIYVEHTHQIRCEQSQSSVGQLELQRGLPALNQWGSANDLFAYTHVILPPLTGTLVGATRFMTAALLWCPKVKGSTAVIEYL